jgi:hypothetical protein
VVFVQLQRRYLPVTNAMAGFAGAKTGLTHAGVVVSSGYSPGRSANSPGTRSPIELLPSPSAALPRSQMSWSRTQLTIVAGREAARSEASRGEAAVRKPSAEVAAKAKSRSAARDSKGRGAEQRGGTECQHRDAVARGSLLKIVSHGITFEVDCDHSQLPIGCLVSLWRSSILPAFTWRLRAFIARSPGPHTPAGSLQSVSLQWGPIYAAGARSGDMNVAMQPQAG